MSKNKGRKLDFYYSIELYKAGGGPSKQAMVRINGQNYEYNHRKSHGAKPPTMYSDYIFLGTAYPQDVTIDGVPQS